MTLNSWESDCDRAQEALFDARDGLLDPEGAERLRAHIENCSACRNAQAWDTTFAQTLRGSDGFVHSGTIEGLVAQRLRRRWMRQVAAVAASAGVVLLIIGVILWARSGPPRNDQTEMVVNKSAPAPNPPTTEEHQPTLRAAFNDSPPVARLEVLARHQDAWEAVLQDFAKESR